MALHTVQVEVTLDPAPGELLQDEVRHRVYDAVLRAHEAEGESLGAITSFDGETTALLVLVDADSVAGARDGTLSILTTAFEGLVDDGEIDTFDIDEPVSIVRGRSPAYITIAGPSDTI